MLMTGYAFNNKEKRILVLRVRSLWARSGVSGKIRILREKVGLSGLQHSNRKTDITQFFNLA
jgi:hypothetical protein